VNFIAIALLVFVTNERSGDVSVIKDNRVVATIKAGARPRGIIAHGDRVYVASSHFKDVKTKEPDAIRVLDAATFKPLQQFACGTDPEGVAITNDGKKLVVSNEDAGTATIVDATTGKTIATLVTGTEPEGVAIGRQTAYVTGETSSTVTVIDLQRNEVVANTFVDARPRGVVFTRNGYHSYVTCEIAGTVQQLDDRHRVIATIKLGKTDHPVGLALSPDQKRLYVATGRGNSVAVIDTKSNKVTSTIAVGQRPWGIGLTPDGRKLYVANGLSNTVSVIDTASMNVVATIKVGYAPWGICVIP
jgi:YVTN family beta-propeller protein